MKRVYSLRFAVLLVLAALTVSACGNGSSGNKDGQEGNSYPAEDSVALTTSAIDSQSVTFNYSLIAEQSPASLGASIITQTPSGVVSETPVSGSSEHGSTTVTGISPATEDYTFNLVTAAGPQAVLATLTLPTGTSTPSSSEHSVSVFHITTTQVMIAYDLIPGSKPHQNSFSIGLWSGDPSNLSLVPPIATATFNSDNDAGVLPINSHLLINQTYTVALLVSTRPQDIAATTTFTATDPL